MNYATQYAQPSAYITKKKSRLKIYDKHNVYLNDGDNFEVEIYNPKTISVLAKIKINGKYISDSGIIVRPGQRLFLERFLDAKNKFVFHTYTIDAKDPNWSAIKSNGDIEIEFYDEVTFNFGNGFLTTGTAYYNTPPSLTTTTYSPTVGSVTFTSANYSSNLNVSSNNNTSTIETGRVEMGNQSNQNFEYSNQQFSYLSLFRVSYKLLPQNTKNISTKELRNYCTECGKKVKNEYKFCPTCGTKI